MNTRPKEQEQKGPSTISTENEYPQADRILTENEYIALNREGKCNSPME